MLLFLSIILCIVIMFSMVTASRMFRGEKFALVEEDKDGKKIKRLSLIGDSEKSARAWGEGALVGLTVALINYLASKTASCLWLAAIMLIIMLCLMIGLMCQWHKRGSNVKESIPFFIMAVLFYLVARAPALMTTVIFMRSAFWASLVNKLPIIFFIFTLGFIIADMFFYYYRKCTVEANEKSLEQTEEADNKADKLVAKGRVSHVAAWIVITVVILVIAILLIGLKWPSATKSVAPVVDPTVAPADAASNTSWYGFYNLSLQKDNVPANDFNFGFNYFSKNRTAKDYAVELENRSSKDPALLSAIGAYVDYYCGTRFIGVFYDECNGAWDAAINRAKEAFMKDPELYEDTLMALFSFLNTAEISVTEATSGIEDQMYMNPYTVDGVPDVIVMKTQNHDGHFLTYTFNIKGEKVEVSYRLECGFQPCNVEKTMGIKPQSRPTPQNPNQPDGGKKTTSGKKDPTKGTQVGPNDDPGPGPDTNNGEGATTSTEDKPTNSGYMTVEEYKEAIDDLKEINENQQVGGKGDMDTDISAPVHIITPEGEVRDISNDSPAGSWGGPPD